MTNAEAVMIGMIRYAQDQLRALDKATHDEACASRREGEWVLGGMGPCDCGANEINEGIQGAIKSLDLSRLEDVSLEVRDDRG